MAKFRSSSCPVDPWEQQSDISPDRAKSVLGGQDESIDTEVAVKSR
jgi:hypothetical protein